MRKKRFNIAGIFVLFNLLFRIVYDLFYAFVYEYGFSDLYYWDWRNVVTVISWIIGILTYIFFFVGLKKENPILLLSPFAWSVLWEVFNAVEDVYYIFEASHPSSYIMFFTGDIADILWNGALIIIILALFKSDTQETPAQEIRETAPVNIALPVKQDPTESLREYKGLLDMGAITREEFEAKKKELLG